MEKKDFEKLPYQDKKRYLEALIREKEMEKYPHLEADPINQYESFPLSDLQEAYLVGKQIGAEEHQNGCHIYYEFEVEDLNEQRLQYAWNVLVSHHNILRDTIMQKGSQRIMQEPEEYQFQFYDGSNQNPDKDEELHCKIREQLSHKVYRAGDYPLYEIRIIKYSDRSSTVYFSMDEWIVDASSIALLFEQWYKLYYDKDYHLDKPELTYRDYVIAQKRFETTKKYQSDLAYWKQGFSGIDQTFFSYLTEGHTTRRTRFYKKFESQTWEAIKSYAESIKVSPTACILAAFLILLNSEGEGGKYPVILTVGDRVGEHPDIQKIVGPFMTTLYYVEEHPEPVTMEEKLLQVQEKLWEITDHRSVSGIRILRELKREKVLDSNYSVPIVFTSMLSSVKKAAKESWYSNVTYSITQTPQVCLDCQVMEERDSLVLHWDVQEDRFPEGMIAGLFQQYVDMLEEMGNTAVFQLYSDQKTREWGLTALQQSYWLLQYGKKGSDWGGIMYQEFEVTDDSLTRLAARWKEIVADTPVLRSVFTKKGMLTEAPLSDDYISCYDLRGLEDQKKAQELEQIRAKARQKGFSLFEAPRFLLNLIQLEENRLCVGLAVDASIADGQSLSILYRRLFDKDYKNEYETIAFSSYMDAYKANQQNKSLTDQSAYWKDRIGKLTDGPFRERQAQEACIGRSTIRLSCFSRLVQYAVKENVSLDAILLGIYKMILAKWDHHNDFTIVGVFWNRLKTIPSIEYTIGDFTEIDWFTFEDTTEELTGSIKVIDRQIRLSGRNREWSSLAELAKQKERPEMPVVYTSLVKPGQARLPGNVSMGHGLAKTPGVILDMISFVEKGTLMINWDYNETVFAQKEITFWLNEYAAQLDSLLGGKRLSTKTIPVLEWDKQCIHSYVEFQAEVNGSRSAVKMKGCQLTYQELNERANMLSGFFVGQGVQAGDFIGICLERSVEMIVVILAVLKAGAAYVPIDPVYPRDRIRYMIDDSKPRLVVINGKFAEKLDYPDDFIINLDFCENEIISQSKINKNIKISGEHIAYIIYTSGSTGRPKGVMVTHRNVVRLFQETEQWFHFTQDDIWTMYHSFAFDFSVWEIWGALLYGGTLLVVPYEVSRSFQEFYEYIAAEKVTVLNQTPTAFNQLMKAESEAGVKELALRYIIFGGEALHFNNLAVWYERHDENRTQLINMYGITETTVHVTYRPISRQDIEEGSSLIGACIPDLKIYLAGDSGQLVRPGEIGEICVSGAGLAKGYLNRPDMTKEKFIDNPYGEGRLYLSGDIGRYTETGEIEYIGRKDKQVKIRGFRIELGEIENVLVSHPHIEQAVVMLETSGKEPRLKAYLLTDRTMIQEAEIRKFVRQKLPDYMVPNVIVEVDKIGLTVNGKLDYKQIVDAVVKNPADKKGTSEDMSKISLELEKQKNAILEIIKEELECDTLDIKEDIFNLGGTSLTIVNIVRRLAEEINVNVPVDLFLENPVIEEILAFISGNVSDAAVSEENGNIKYRTIAKESFSRILGLLKKETIHGNSSYLYASAGGKNAVQVYVYVKKDGVEGVEEGVYYYHPETHALYYISTGDVIDEHAYADVYRDVYHQSAYAVYFIAQLTAIEPVYMDFSEGLVTIDSGYIKQLLLSGSEAKETGLIGVDTIDFERIAQAFKLDDKHLCLSGMLGGNGYTEQDFVLPSDWTGKDMMKHMKTVPAYPSKDKQEALIRNMQYNQLSKKEIVELARKKLHIRTFQNTVPIVTLNPVKYEEQRYTNRASKRIFSGKKIEKEKLLGLLAELAQNKDGSYSYPSIGNQYLIHVYLYVKNEAVDGLEEGAYLYNRRTGTLETISLSIRENIEYLHTPFNRPHYKLCKFCIFLVLDTKAAEAVYSKPYFKYALAEAGTMGQILTNAQAEFGLGLVPIGGMNFDKLHKNYGLSQDHMLIHSFMGGAYEYADHAQGEEKDTAVEEQAAAVAVHSMKEKEVVIIGISGRFPMADSVIEFWDNLKEGRNAITAVPGSRWHESALPFYGGFINHIDAFDSGYFNMAPEEAKYLDPQARLFLTSVNEAFYDAGYQMTNYKESRNIGVFVGSMYQQYHLLARGEENEDIMAIQSYSSIANRTSYYFNFTGPSIATDTACSSAAAAVAMACASIRSGETDTCVAGGVNLSLHPSKYSALKKMGLLSSQDRMTCFGDGEGFIPGEGVGVLILKEREKAERDGNHIYAAINGMQISHSGKTRAYSMPSTFKEQELIQDTLDAASIRAKDIEYVECAANGISLADAAEYNALKHIFEGCDKKEVSVGSVKSNIGHLEAASGMAQIIKVLMQFRHRQLVPTIYVNKLNPLIQEKASKLSIVKENTVWNPVSGKRTALINTFAAGGTNVCTILTEYNNDQSQDSGTKEYVILLSAHHPNELKKMIPYLLEYVKRADIEMRDIEYTFSLFQQYLPARAVVLCHDKEDFITKLGGLKEGTETGGIFTGFYDGVSNIYSIFREEEKGVQIVKEWLKERNITALSELWVHGIEIQWRREGVLKGGSKIPLAFPFYQERSLWLDSAFASSQESGEEDSNRERLTSVQEEPQNEPIDPVGLLMQLMEIEDNDITLDTSLQSIGFNSIYAIKLLTKLREYHQREITISNLMSAETLKDIRQMLG